MPVVSADSWLQAAARSRRSLPTASSRARRPASSALRPACRNSPRRKSIRSPKRLIVGQSTRRAPPLTRSASRALFLAPPACVTTRNTSGGGDLASLTSSALRSFVASCADLTTTMQPPPNRDGAVRFDRSPAVRPAAATWCTSTRSARSGPSLAADAAGGADGSAVSGALAWSDPDASVTAAVTARSTSSSSSPTITVTGAAAWAARPGPEAMHAACHESRSGRDGRAIGGSLSIMTGILATSGSPPAVWPGGLARRSGPAVRPGGLARRSGPAVWPGGLGRRALAEQGFPAAPDPHGLHAIGPAERALVVCVPGDNIDELAASHRAAIRGPERLRPADGRGPERLGHAHPEHRDREADDQRHRGNAVPARRVVRTKRDWHALVQECPHRWQPAGVRRSGRAQHSDYTCPGQRRDVVVTGTQQQVGRGAAELGGQQRGAVARITACVQSRQQSGSPPGVQDPACLAGSEPALVAVGVDAVRACRGGVLAPAADCVHVVVAPAEELRRHRGRRHERDMHARHAGLLIQRPQQPDIG